VARLDPESLSHHVDALYRAAWALCGSREDAEDLVQETFALVLARPRTVHGPERAYLMGALRNTFASRLRTASRRVDGAASPATDREEPADSHPRNQPERAAEINEILAAIGDLPTDFRCAIVAVDILGLSYAEAGDALGAREATITTRLYRARQRIAGRLRAEPEPDPAPPDGARAPAPAGNSIRRALADALPE
jgi:RNA polymerase sigma-70 factor (ECF subfamily)